VRKNYLGSIITVAVVILGLALLSVLFACTPPDVDTANVRIVNSAWRVVREATVRSITSTDDLEADVDAYNMAHTDDQWRIIYGEVPPIEAAPTADAFIVTGDTHEPTNTYLGIQRSDLEARRATWRLQVELDSAAAGRPCVLYVDNVPPAPVVVAPAPVDPYVAYAIYVLDKSGAVLWEEHPDADQYAARLAAWRLSIEVQNAGHPADPWTLVTGRVYP
jgi:hypothetical protein